MKSLRIKTRPFKYLRISGNYIMAFDREQRSASLSIVYSQSYASSKYIGFYVLINLSTN